MQEWQEVKKELLRDPKVRREYDRQRPQYELTRQLIKARLDNKLTQEQLAEKIGVKQEYIARLESGSANPTFTTLNRVAKALGKKVAFV